MAAFAVLGATSWGTTLAWLLATNGHQVSLLCRTEEEAAAVSAQRGLERLPMVQLPVAVTPLPMARARAAAGIVAAVPAQSMRAALTTLPGFRDVPILSAAKGLEHGTDLRMSQVIAAAGWLPQRISVLSGPNLAREVGAGLPAAAVVASTEPGQAAMWQLALSGRTFRVYMSADVPGVELGGALKNIVAIAAGACAGLGLGANAMAAVMTRGLAEITRLGAALGAQPLTFQGLAGVGDLSVTCMSPLSRNHRCGALLARGATPAAAIAEIGEAVEGAETAPVALELARRLGIEMPITEQVCAVLAGTADVRTAMAELLGRAPSAEPETGA